MAFVAHRGQLDRVGAEYIDHPGRVAERFDPAGEHVLVASAWLHDVLEDSTVTAQDLLDAGVQPEVVEIVRLLTRTAEVSDADYYARIARHPEALRVKLADIDDNTAPWRTRKLDREAQAQLAEKYRHAREALAGV
ncbi:phosphohydrolase [Agromyces sp. CFH 90414]|uniref:Phosphohydrolase n=1 Tax=Agromyces agglutinans TaxID=2662258 RepID=A0A6I2F6Q4_9MICO|nr:phosphohydrolase [Agromyces agglutinans]